MPHILFVDDERSVLDALKRRFNGAAPSWALSFLDSPKAALKLVQDQDVAVVIADMAMPEMSGLEMIKKMKQVSPQTHYIMLTGTADLQTAMKAINDVAVFRFYTKPADANLISEGIEQALADRGNNANPEEKEADSNDIGDLGLAALDHLAVGVIVADRQARVRFSNSMGGVLLSEQDGLTLSAGEVCRASVVEETQLLHGLIRAVCDGQESTDTPALSLTRPSARRPLATVVRPVHSRRKENSEPTGIPPLAAIFVTDPERRPPPAPQILEQHLGLTPAEARLVSVLAQGHSIDSAATKCGVTVATARSYLKQIFSKTSTNRQAELVKLVMTSPGIYQND
ncbi:MAG: response regulator [Rhodospirillaceae bacterium]